MPGSEIERLRRELEQARAREEEARAREEEARAREEAARAREEAARAREEEARAREEDERRKNQKTTLDEYLYNCHFHLYKKLVLADPSQSSTGFTKVDGKYYPKWLRPWNRFTNTHQPQHFGVIREVCGGRRLFHQASTTKDLGATISRKKAGNESAIDHFEKLAVEDPAWEVLRPLWDDQKVRGKYQCAALRFSNNHRDITAPSSDDQVKQEVGEGGRERRRRTGPSKRVASEQRVKLTPKLPPIRPDGWGVRTHPGGDESNAFVYDYKAARKIAAGSVKLAVSKETLFLEVMLRVNSSKTQNDVEGRGQERTEELIAMALTQVFDYMVRNEVTYGYVTAGESLLFLHVDRSDLQTLYCHVCLPGEDVGDPSDGDWSSNRVAYTAVAQLASFCLLTLLSDALRGASLDEASHTAEATLQKWPELYEDARHVLSAEDTDSPSASSSQSTDANFASSAGATGREIALRSRSSCKKVDVAAWDGDEDDDVRPNGPPDTGTRTSVRKRKDGPSSGSSEDDAEISSSVPTGPYCTQKCLLALKRGGALDGSCPNVRLHRPAGGGSQHPISASDFTKLISEQLRRSPYLKCDALDRSRKMGSSGVLFKLELAPYGYTFVGKGAWSGLPTVLEHETKIYARLDRLQGDVVPVHLGMVSLDRGHALAGGIRIHHMMLLSWAGEKAADAKVSNLAAETGRCLKAVWAEGVKHWDERDDNLLWNVERARVMLIDFDRATLVPSPTNKPLIKIAGNKRKRKEAELGNSPKRASFRGGVQVA